MNPEQRVERAISELRHLDAEIGELRGQLTKRDEMIKSLQQRLAEGDAGGAAEVEAADTLRVTRQQVILAKAKAEHGSADAEKLAEKLIERDRDSKRMEGLLNAKTLEVRRGEEQLAGLTAALEKIGRGTKHKELIASAMRYYVATPLLTRFGELLAGTLELDPQIPGPDGRTMAQQGLFEETSSGLGGLSLASLGSKPIAIKGGRLVLEERYRNLLATWLRHAAEQQLASQLDVLARSVGEGFAAELKTAIAGHKADQ